MTIVRDTPKARKSPNPKEKPPSPAQLARIRAAQLAWADRKAVLYAASKPRAPVVRLRPRRKRRRSEDEPAGVVIDFPRPLRWCDCGGDCACERRRRKFLARQTEIRGLAAEVAALRMEGRT